MKRIITVILGIALIFSGGSVSAIDRPEMINQRAAQLTPWLINYQLQTVEEAATGRDAGEGCQRVYSIGISPVNSNYMLYGLDTNMLFKSHDGGATWSNSYNGFVPWAAHSIVFHPSEEKTAFCVGSASNDAESTVALMKDADKIGVYKTTDAGETWTQVLNANMFINYNYTDKLLAFDSNEVLYALSVDGVLKSRSPYTEWDTVYEDELGTVYDIDVSPDGMRITIAAKKGLITSFDGGSTWENRTIRKLDVPCLGIDTDPRDDSHWLASFGAPIRSVFESFDNGRTWTGFNTLKKNVDNAAAKIDFGPVRADGSVWLYARNVVSPSYSFSTDEGKTWNRAFVEDYETIFPGNYGSVPEGFAICETDPDVVFYSFRNIIYKSTDGGKTFKWSSTGAVGLYPMYMKRDSEGKLWLGTADQCLLNTVEPFDGTNYPAMHEVFNLSRYVTAFDFDPLDKKHMIICFAQSYNGKLMESYDGGKTFKDIPDTKTGQDVLVEFNKKDPNIVYSTKYISRDRGKTWIGNTYNGFNINIQSVSPIDADIVWGSCGSRYICVSKDSGKNWRVVYDVKKLNPGHDDIDYTIKKIIADCGDENSAYFIVNSGLNYGVTAKYDGKTVRVLNDTDMETGYRYSIAQDPKLPSHLLVSYANADKYYYKSNGVYESYDDGRTWNVIPGIPGTGCIRNMMFDADLDIVYMGGFNGFFIYTPSKLLEYRSNLNEQ